MTQGWQTEQREELWRQTLSHLQRSVERSAYDTWLAPIQLLGGDELGLDLCVPDAYFFDYVSSHLHGSITRSLRQIAAKPLEVRLLIADPSLAEQPMPGSAGANAGMAVTTDAGRAGGPVGATGAPERQPDLPFAAAPASPHRQGELGLAQAHQPQRRPDHLVASLGFDSFVVGEPNRLAHGAAMTVAESAKATFNPLFLHGGVGIGKTHLLHAVGLAVRERRPHTRILYAPAASFIDDFISAMRSRDAGARSRVRDRYRGVDLLLLDDLQFLEGKDKTQEEFFHTFNALHQAGKQIVLTSDRPPSELGAFQDRLRSRFDWGLVAELSAPDRDMRVTILRHKADERGALLTLDVIHYIADHLRNNVRELEGALNKLLLHARISRREPDLALAREVLGPVIEQPGQRLTIDAVQRATVKHFGLRMSDLKGSKRHRAVVEPRMIAMFLARKHTESSFPEIGRAFGGRDHSTVINACKKVKWRLSTQERVKADIATIEKALGL